MAEHEDELRRFVPQLLYDSQETYFADSAAEWTDNPANVLRREPQTGKDPVILASATPGEREEKLTLDFLGEVSYANGARAHPGDQISDAPPDYREQYARLRSPRYANVIYARAATDRESLLWLQYWFWYFYNDERLAFDIGAHEGDWEMIQLRLAGEGGTPDLAVYAQHARAERRPWDLVARATGRPETPLVYVGRGSHASYFEPGLHVTDVWYDIVDGARPAPAARLEFLDDLPWARWPGRWGGTPKRIAAVDQDSPVAPCRHSQWHDPAALLDRAVEHALRAPDAAPDGIRLARDDGYLVLAWDLARERPGARAIIVNVNSADEPGVAPRAYTFDVERSPRARLQTTIELDPAKHYELHVSVIDATGMPSTCRRVLIEPPVSRGFDLKTILRAIGRFVAWVRARRR